MDTQLVWALGGADGSGVVCHLDANGDGTFDQIFDPCPLAGRVGHTFTTWGKFEPALKVIPQTGDPLTARTVVYSNHLVPADNVLFPEQLGALSDVALGPDTVRLAYLQPGVEIPVGALIWGTMHGGYVRRVSSFEVDGSTITLTTTPATMEEAFVDGFFGVHDAQLQFEGAECISDCPPNVAVRVNTSRAAFDETVTFTWGALRFPSDATVQATFSGVELELRLRASIEIGFIPRRFHMVVTPSVEAHAAASLYAGVSATRRLGTYTLGVVPIGPLAFTVTFEPELGVTAQVGAAVSADLAASMTATGELHWDAAHSSASVTGSATASLTHSVDTQAGFRLEAALSTPFAFKLMGGLGPYIGPELRLTGAYDAISRCLDVGVAAGAQLGAELDLWLTNITIAEVSTELYGHDFPQVCWPPAPDTTDASVPDARPIDALVSTDARPPDASPLDAHAIDATDAVIDAQPMDASPIDAQPGDASAIDASLGPVALASGLTGLHQLTIDNTYVYWVENWLGFNGMLKRVPKAGGAVTTLASGLAQPNAVIVDSSHAYVIERNGGTMGNGRVVRVPISGGAPELVVGGLSNAGTFLLQDGAFLYLRDFNSVKRVPKAPNSSATILLDDPSLGNYGAIATDGSHLYFRNNVRRLLKMPIGGGAVQDFGQVDVGALVVTGGTIYFADMANGLIGSMPATGGIITTHSSGLVSPGNLVVDSGYIYWIEWSNPGAVRRVAISGGPWSSYSNFGNTFGIATDSAYVYWAMDYLTGQGQIMRAPK